MCVYVKLLYVYSIGELVDVGWEDVCYYFLIFIVLNL